MIALIPSYLRGSKVEMATRAIPAIDRDMVLQLADHLTGGKHDETQLANSAPDESDHFCTHASLDPANAS